MEGLIETIEALRYFNPVSGMSMLVARDLQGTVWLLAMSRPFPDRRPRAEEMLAHWRRRGGLLG